VPRVRPSFGLTRDSQNPELTARLITLHRGLRPSNLLGQVARISRGPYLPSFGQMWGSLRFALSEFLCASTVKNDWLRKFALSGYFRKLTTLECRATVLSWVYFARPDAAVLRCPLSHWQLTTGN